MTSEKDYPVINCHTHIFLGGHVPPYLAKTFVPWPFYYLLNTRFVLWLLGFFIQKKNKTYKDPQIANKRKKRLRKIWLQRNPIVNFLFTTLKLSIGILTFVFIFQWIMACSNSSENMLSSIVNRLEGQATESKLGRILINPYIKILIVGVVFLFFKSIRNAVWSVLKILVKAVRAFPGKMTKDLLNRYILLGRFTIYSRQARIFSAMIMQYDPGTKFIVLPMDMEYMGAGKLKSKFNYRSQLNELADIMANSPNKDAFLPFIFIEPRRMENESDYLVYDSSKYNAGEVNLGDCFVREYIVEKRFFGFKIYPALGYYPFDARLLPLWKYAADNNLPIMTHCIKGTIFYRGKKNENWNIHPIFKEVVNLDNKEYDSLLLPQNKNLDFSLNFTHPLNYLVLLKEELLRVFVSQCGNEIKELFGYKGLDNPMQRNLSHLKICFAHFGGEDQWNKFLERDRYRYSNEVISNPESGINFLYTKEGEFSWKKLEDCWKYVDWYSIISSMILQHENVYADISYILHDKSILDLLKHTIDSPGLGNKVLFGTDFYVVRNHLSEKSLRIQTQTNLSPAQFDKIAKINPYNYLYQ